MRTIEWHHGPIPLQEAQRICVAGRAFKIAIEHSVFHVRTGKWMRTTERQGSAIPLTTQGKPPPLRSFRFKRHIPTERRTYSVEEAVIVKPQSCENRKCCEQATRGRVVCSTQHGSPLAE